MPSPIPLSGSIAVIAYTDAIRGAKFILAGYDTMHVWSLFSSDGTNWNGQVVAHAFEGGSEVLQAPSLCVCAGRLYLGFTALEFPWRYNTVIYEYGDGGTWTQIYNQVEVTNSAVALAALPSGTAGAEQLWMFWGSMKDSDAFAQTYDPEHGQWGDSMTLPYSMYGAPSACVIPAPPGAAPTLFQAYNNNNGAVGMTFYDGRTWQTVNGGPDTGPGSGQFAVGSDASLPGGEPVIAEIDGNGNFNYYRRIGDGGFTFGTMCPFGLPAQTPALVSIPGNPGRLIAYYLNGSGQPESVELSAMQREEPFALANPNPPPVVGMYWTNGINVRTMSIDGSPIFAPTYQNGQTITLQGQSASHTYDVPDHVTFSQQAATDTLFFAGSIEYTADYANAFGVQLGASSSSEELSISGDTSVSYAGEILTDEQMFYEVAFLATTFGVSNIPGDYAPLHSGFAASLKALEAALPPPTDPQWAAFFERYGTHFLQRGSFGGLFALVCTIEQSVLQTMQSTEVHGKYQADFNDLVSSQALDTSGFDQCSSLVSQIGSQMSVATTTLGGVAGLIENYYVQSCADQPALLAVANLPAVCNLPVLQPISVLASGKLQNAIDAALVVYGVSASSSIVQKPERMKPNETFQAPTDGILMALGTSAGDQVQIVSDGNSPPTSIIAQGLADGSPRAIFGPIRKGDFSIAATNQPITGFNSARALFMPLSLPNRTDPVFGPRIAAAVTWDEQGSYRGVEQGDGFVILNANLPSASGRMSCVLNGVTEGFNFAFSEIIQDGSDVFASLIMPVFKGQPYAINSTLRAIKEVAEITYMPLAGGVSFGKPFALPPNTATQAQTDMLCWMPAFYPGNASLNVGPTGDTVDQANYAVAFTQVGSAAQYLVATIGKGQWIYPSSTTTLSPPIAIAVPLVWK